MNFDLDGAVTFVATRGRVLERRRLELLLGRGAAEDVLAALDAYRNADGGYGWGLEPDLRSASSQPVGAMHALELLAEMRDTATRRPVEILDWLVRHTGDDGGVPFALAFADTEGSAGHWAAADPSASSLTMTAQLAAQAHRLARHRADVAGHPWLAAATDYCRAAIAAMREPHAYELMFTMHFLDALGDRELIERAVRHLRTDGPTAVSGGAEGEVLHLLDFAPHAEGPVRRVFPAAAVEEDLRRLAVGQQADGGWTVDFPTYGPAAALEWRGYATVGAVRILRGGRL
ncbi:MAG TPA: hypothetical protein VGB74_07440 [Actinoplanes sp.]|jgi:hypothetical protein